MSQRGRAARSWWPDHAEPGVFHTDLHHRAEHIAPAEREAVGAAREQRDPYSVGRRRRGQREVFSNNLKEKK